MSIDPETNKTNLNEKGKPIYRQVELSFLDSFKLLSSSLEKLTNTLKPEKFKELTKHYPDQLELVRGKLAYPYDYIDSIEKYNEETLPNIDKFYSALAEENVSKKVYENALSIWETFKVKNMREFTLLYNKLDVALITDIMENYRKVSLERFKLDPVHYYTTPGFAWNAMLKKTEVEQDLIRDCDMYLMFMLTLNCI